MQKERAARVAALKWAFPRHKISKGGLEERRGGDTPCQM